MMKYSYAFFLATSLLTRIPIHHRYMPNELSDDLKSLSALFYPFVGVLAGLFISIVVVLFSWMIGDKVLPLVMACVALTSWVFITGALHLDGLADSTDAAFASHGNKDRTLAVFKDPHAGPMAVVSVCLALIIKFSLLGSFFSTGSVFFVALLVVASMFISRLVAVVFIAYTPYKSDRGLASGICLSQYKKTLWLLVFVTTVLCVFFLPAYVVFCLLAVIGAWGMYWRKLWMNKIGGYTGDCLGALIEVSEILCLFVFVVLLL